MDFFKENETALLHFLVLSRTWTACVEEKRWGGAWAFGSLPASMELV